MQSQFGRDILDTHYVQIHDAPSRALLAQIARFQDDEADWNSTVFDLSSTNATFAIVYDNNACIVGVATINDFSPQSHWLGNVVVAKNARRRGIGSRMVSELLNHAEKRKERSSVVLMSTELGKGIYKRLGFEIVNEVKVTLYVRPAMLPPTKSRMVPKFPTPQELEDAIQLDKETHGVDRGALLRAVFKQHRLCTVLKSGSTVVAAAWGRYLALPKKDYQPELHIGPVVAKCPEFAASVTGELLRMDQRANAAKRDTAAGALVLGVQHGSSVASKLAFESLGFIQSGELPYMRKRISSPRECPTSGLDVVRANAYYYAMTWWDIA